MASNRRWRGQFRYRGSRRQSAVAQLSTLDLMPYPKTIVLNCHKGYEQRLDSLVEDFIRDGVSVICVVGEDCCKVEDAIDWIVVGNGDRDYHILTTSHPDESIDDVVLFANTMTDEGTSHIVEV
jgi:hypothetical protein